MSKDRTRAGRAERWRIVGEELFAVGSPRLFNTYLRLLEEETWRLRRRAAPREASTVLDGLTPNTAVPNTDWNVLAGQIVDEPNRLCVTCEHPAKNHTLGRCRKKRCGCGGWRG